MHIAILGTGRMARGVAWALRETTHPMTFGSREPARAAALADEMSSEQRRRYHGTGLAAAAARADLAFLAVPFAAAVELAAELREALDRKVLVDLTNPIAPGGGLAVPHDTSAAEEVQRAAGGRVRVVAALKNTFAATLAEPRLRGGPPPDVLVAGDDADARRTVGELVEAMGFVALDAGPLAVARTIERMTLLLLDLDRHHHWDGQAGFKLLRPES